MQSDKRAVLSAETTETEVEVVKVGTFAAGLTPAGENTVVTDAPVGSFAEGHPVEEDIA